jgi:hypothetical protein
MSLSCSIAVARVLPSGEMATEPNPPAWAFHCFRRLPASTSQISTLPLPIDTANCFPSFVRAMPSTKSLIANVNRGLRKAKSQTTTVQPLLEETNDFPSGVKARPVMPV